MKPRFRGAVFDMDGTLIASEAIYRDAWRLAATEAARPMTEADYTALMGLNRADTLAALSRLWSSVPPAERFLAASERHYEQLVRERGHTVRAGIRDLLRRLRELGVALGVATSSHRELAESTLAEVRLRHFFSAVVTGDEVRRGKPDPEIFTAVARYLGVPPAACVAFEDSAAGAAAAAGAGMTVVLIPETSFAPPSSLPAVLRYAHHAEALALFAAP